jgi:hypothetical protein
MREATAQTVKLAGTATAQIRSNFAQLAGLIPARCKRAWNIEAFYCAVQLSFGLPILRTALRCTRDAVRARDAASIDGDPQASQTVLLA